MEYEPLEDWLKTILFCFGLLGLICAFVHSWEWIGLTVWMWSLVDLFNTWTKSGVWSLYNE